MLAVLEFVMSSWTRYFATIGLICALAVPIRCLRLVTIRIDGD